MGDLPTTSFMDVFIWLCAKLDKNGLLSCLALAWAAWAYHNSVEHGEQWSNLEVGAVGFLKLVLDYTGYAVKTQGCSMRDSLTSRSSWAPPALGWIRVNTDAAMLEGTTVGAGAVFRDELGRVSRAAVHRYRARWSVALAEAMAAKVGLQEALKAGHTRVELECDAYNLVKAITQQHYGRSPLDLVIEDIVSLSSNFTHFSISHVKRGGNTVAHLLARVNPMNGVEQIFVDDVQQGILALAELDVG